MLLTEFLIKVCLDCFKLKQGPFEMQMLGGKACQKIQKWYTILNTRIIPLARISKIYNILFLRTSFIKKKIQSLISLA